MFARDLILKLFNSNEDDLHQSRMWSLFRAENINNKIFDSKDFSEDSRKIVKVYDPGSQDFLEKLKDDNQMNEDFWKSFYVSIVNSQGTFIPFWKELFYILYNASEDQVQDSPMWKLFKKMQSTSRKIFLVLLSSLIFTDLF